MGIEWAQLAFTVGASVLGASVSVAVSYVNLRERFIRLESKVEPLTKNGVYKRIELLESRFNVHEAVQTAITHPPGESST